MRVVFHHLLAKADPGPQADKVTGAFGQSVEFLDHPAVHEDGIAGVSGDSCFAK